MASRFEQRFQRSSIPMLNREFGATVTLSRGVQLTSEFTARRGDRIHQALGREFGLTIEITMRDFWLPASSLLIDGDTIKPRIGDRITEGDEVFEISPLDENRPAVELLAGGYEYLVHTNRVE